MTLLFLAAMLGVACTSPLKKAPFLQHDASACWHSADPLWTPPWELDTGSGGFSESFAGQVVGLEPKQTELYGERCEQATRAVEIEATNGSRLVLAWGWPEAPAASLSPGDAVEGTIRYVAQHGTSTGFVLRRDSVLVAAVEVGLWGPALLPTDHDEVTVSTGEVVALMEDDCGEHSSTQLRFVGDTEVSVAPTESAELTAAGQPLVAFTLDAEERGYNGRCADDVGELSWALFRP